MPEDPKTAAGQRAGKTGEIEPATMPAAPPAPPPRKVKPEDPTTALEACFFSLGQDLAHARYQVSAAMEQCGARPTYAVALRRLLALSYALRVADHILIDAAEAVDAGSKELHAHRAGRPERERTP